MLASPSSIKAVLQFIGLDETGIALITNPHITRLLHTSILCITLHYTKLHCTALHCTLFFYALICSCILISVTLFSLCFITYSLLLELQRAGARTLTNMLMQTTDMELEFRRSAVEHMSFLATNTDSEICEMCVICLCFASQSEPCRELIVTSGMLSKIGGKYVRYSPV